eukprot:Selendium_serpulae@DN4975_c0_g1_i3.p1
MAMGIDGQGGSGLTDRQTVGETERLTERHSAAPGRRLTGPQLARQTFRLRCAITARRGLSSPIVAHSVHHWSGCWIAAQSVASIINQSASQSVTRTKSRT